MNEATLDHDLLIELRTEMRNIRADIKELKDGTAKRIDDLEKEKADKKELQTVQDKLNEDIETRIRVLENWRMYSLGATAVISFVIYWLSSKFFSSL